MHVHKSKTKCRLLTYSLTPLTPTHFLGSKGMLGLPRGIDNAKENITRFADHLLAP